MSVGDREIPKFPGSGLTVIFPAPKRGRVLLFCLDAVIDPILSRGMVEMMRA